MRLVLVLVMLMHGGRCVLVVVVRVRVCRMIVHRVIVPDLAVMRRLGVRVLGVRMPMDMGMGRLMRGVRMVVRDRGERSRVIAGLACTPIAKGMNECAALHPSEAGADQRDQAIADNLNGADGIVHGLGRCVERDSGDAHQQNRD
ncbi:MAG: hypothetical protein WAL40_03850, partial [Rhodoplanes sp.]